MTNRIHRLRTAPQPTLIDPHAQIKWAFFQVEAEKREPTAGGIRHAKNTYLRFVSETHAYYDELEKNPRFYLDQYWESDALIRFNKWLNTQALKSKSRYSIYKNVRQVMDMAYALRTIDSIVYHAPMFKGVSETKERSAYNKREQEIINAAIAKWISLAINVTNGYSPTGEGIPYQQVNFSTSITIDGKTLPVEDAAKVYGITKPLMLNRLRLGWSDRQIVGIDPRLKPGAKILSINGQTYDSISDAARAFNLDFNLVYSRIRGGWTPEQAVGIDPRRLPNNIGRPKELMIDNIKFESIKLAAKAYGIDYKVVKGRMYSGWSAREALGLDKRKLAGNEIVIEGVIYSSLSQAANAYGLGHETVSARIRRGLTPEQAVGITPIYVEQSDDRAILWMFENTYLCDPTAMFEDFHVRKLTRIGSLKRLLSLFSRWGVWPYVDTMLIMPLAVELAMLTGLNVESLKSLELDSYTPEHPLTGQPAISYRKPRSGSARRSEDRELHIPILDNEELYIDDPVAEKIHKVIGIVKELTSRIRPDAPADIAKRLFLFEDVEKSYAKGIRVVVAIDPHGKTITWRRRFAKQEGFFALFGDRFNFNIARCRPTLATNMVLSGADLFQVQAALGHQSVQTTASYLDELQLQPVFNKTVSEALQQISRRSQDAQSNQAKTVTGDCNDGNIPDRFHETISGCGCKNAYNPSENVRKATNFKEGSVCKYWNMCLLCDNSIITQSSLPKLINYNTRISQALAEAGPSIKSRVKLFEDTVTLIKGILEPGNIFPKEVIDHAFNIAVNQDDLLIDQLVYQGI